MPPRWRSAENERPPVGVSRNDFNWSRVSSYFYQTSRSGKHVQNFLRWQGHLLVDDYGGYKALFSKTASPCTELGCWAHARRKFFDLHQANASTVAFEHCNALTNYAVEAKQALIDRSTAQLRAEKACRS
ncbi:MAG: transposase [Nitrosomonas sp.]|nr:transposase [Nitrosomonas sp.]